MSRYTVTAVTTYLGETRTLLGVAPSRRKARRIAYRTGQGAAPSMYSRAMFDIEIVDTVTGVLVPAGWAEREALRRRANELTVGEVGYW